MSDANEVSASVVFRTCLANGLASGFAVSCCNPMDVLRVRWQVRGASTSSGSAKQSLAAFTLSRVREEGLVELWRCGLAANGVSVGASSFIRMGSYPFVRDTMVATAGSSGLQIPSATCKVTFTVTHGCASTLSYSTSRGCATACWYFDPLRVLTPPNPQNTNNRPTNTPWLHQPLLRARARRALHAVR